MTPDPTFPSTPSPMPVSPRRVTAAAAQVSARSSAPFAPPLLGGPPTPLAPPVPSSQTSSGFRRAPSLARRLRRLGLLATVLVVGGVYQQLKGGPDDAPSSRQVTAGAVAQAPLGEPTSGSEHGEPRATREEPKAKAISQASRVTTVASADRAQPSDRAGASRPGPARAAVRCCEPTQQELAEAAAKGELKIRGPQVSGKSLVVPEGTVAELRLSPDQVARIEKLFADSNRRMHAELLQFNREADTRARETENNFQLFDELRELPKSEFRASVHQLARERAGIIPRQRSDQDPIVLKALDAVLEEDERAITELEALVGAEKARAVMASGKHSRVFSPPRLGR